MINFFPIYINKFYGTNIAKINHQILRSRSFISKNGRLTTFQRIKCVGNEFEIFDSQDSSMQNILSKSDGIIMRNSYAKPIKKNEYVKILTFNNITENYI
jgi:molybdopterin biosynthesis enzyme